MIVAVRMPQLAIALGAAGRACCAGAGSGTDGGGACCDGATDGEGELTVTLRVMLAAAPSSSVTVTLARNVPASRYVWLTFWPVSVPPSPNSHS